MENQRETRQIITPSGHKVKIFEYMTGREKRELDKVFFENINPIKVKKLENQEEVNEETPEIKNNGELYSSREDAMIKLMVSEIKYKDVEKTIKNEDGTESVSMVEGEIVSDPNEILSRILDMRVPDYEMITRELNSIVNPKDEESKEKKLGKS